MKKILILLIPVFFNLVGCASSSTDGLEAIREWARLVGEPVPIEYATVDYPVAAYTKSLEGQAVVVFDILPTGEPTNMVVTESTDSLFDDPSIAAVAESRFEPSQETFQGFACAITYEIDAEAIEVGRDVFFGGRLVDSASATIDPSAAQTANLEQVGVVAQFYQCFSVDALRAQ